MDRRRLILSMAALAASGCVGRAGSRETAQEQALRIGRLIADEWAIRPEIMRYDVDPVHAVHYAEVATALGVIRLAEQTFDVDLVQRIRRRWERAQAIPNTANHVDANVVAIWPLLLGETDTHVTDLIDGQWEETGSDGLTTQARFWIDDIWMIGALQMEAWRYFRKPHFRDRAALMARIYVERLQQANGLFHHGPDAPFFWGRGNGWVAAGLAEVLSGLPAGHPERPVILAAYRRMMEALLSHQADDGMWRQLIDHPQAWKETSGSAMFAFAMLRGVNGGALPAQPYGDAARRAWSALTAHVDAQGLLAEVCVGTGQSRDVQYYLDRPRVTGDLHGQAALLWLAAEMLV